MTFKEFIHTDVQPTVPKWKVTKPEILDYWKKLRTNTPILMKPIDPMHKGSTYGEDGLRITGSPQFIGSVLSRLKELVNYENPYTKLSVIYRQIQPHGAPSNYEPNKTSYVFYASTKKREIKKIV